jgi:ABC-type glutathione transport system ATPase component
LRFYGLVLVNELIPTSTLSGIELRVLEGRPAAKLSELVRMTFLAKAERLSSAGRRLPVFENINIALRGNEILGLLGRSGSGKSTLPRIASGLIKHIL